MLVSDNEKNLHSSAHLRLCDYLSSKSIVIEPKPLSKEAFLNELILCLCEVGGLKDVEAVKKAVWDREKEGRTVLENGLAIPHARFEGIQQLKACLGILPQGYEDSQEKLSIKWVFLFLYPQEQFRNHLQMLACISKVFQDKSLMDGLLRANTPKEAFELIQYKEKSEFSLLKNLVKK